MKNELGFQQRGLNGREQDGVLEEGTTSFLPIVREHGRAL